MARSKTGLDPAADAAMPEPADLAELIPRPHLEVLERGLQNVFGLPSAKIALKDPAMVTHWINTQIGANQLGKALDAGYLKARPEMLADTDRVSFTVSPEGYVTRGERHAEILVYTLAEWAQKRAQKKADENRRMMNPGATKAQVAEAAAAQFGEEAADYLHSHSGPVGSVRDQYERIHRSPEGDGEA